MTVNPIRSAIEAYVNETADDSQASWVDKNRPHCVYVILITPRSGSTFLTHALSKTGRLGTPQEWFNKDSISDLLVGSGVKDMSMYIDFLIKSKQSDNGIFGVQFSWPQFRMTNDLIDFASYIEKPIIWFFMRRINIVAQAISLYIAEKTGLFHSYQLKDFPKVDRDSVPYDGGAIKRHLTMIAKQEAAIESHFSNNKVYPIELFYEDVVKSEEATINLFRNVLRVRPLPVAAQIENPIKRMSTKVNSELEARFRNEETAFLEELRDARPSVRRKDRIV